MVPQVAYILSLCSHKIIILRWAMWYLLWHLYLPQYLAMNSYLSEFIFSSHILYHHIFDRLEPRTKEWAMLMIYCLCYLCFFYHAGTKNCLVICKTNDVFLYCGLLMFTPCFIDQRTSCELENIYNDIFLSCGLLLFTCCFIDHCFLDHMV
jgi:hypothetical protein